MPLPPTQDPGPVKTQPLRTFCLPSASDIRKESGPSCELYCYIGFIIKYNFRILLVKNFQLNSIITRTHTNLSNCAVYSLSAVFKLFVAALVRNIKTLRRVFLSHFTLDLSKGLPSVPAVSSRRNVCIPRHLAMMNAVPRDAAHKILPNAKNYKKHRLLGESGERAQP